MQFLKFFRQINDVYHGLYFVQLQIVLILSYFSLNYMKVLKKISKQKVSWLEGPGIKLSGLISLCLKHL